MPPELKHEDKFLIFIHGGGCVVNSPKTQLAFQAAITSRLGVKVPFIEYPLAPEHPYSAVLNAVLDAYLGLRNRYGAENIGLFGTSAGGGFVLATLLRLKQEGLPLPATSASLSPRADMTLSGDLFALAGENDQC